MNLIGSLTKYLSGAVLFGKLSSSGWIGFFLIAFLPFIGVRFLEWHPGMMLTGYVIDRIIYLLFFFVMETIMLKRSNRLEASQFARQLFAVLVMSYMLLQFFGLIISLAGIASSLEGMNEILALTGAIFLLYGYQFVMSLKSENAELWQPKVFQEGVLLVLLTGFTILFSLVIGIFLTGAIRDSFLAPFFDTGYGVVIFLFVVIRLLVDIWFFTRKSRV